MKISTFLLGLKVVSDKANLSRDNVLSKMAEELGELNAEHLRSIGVKPIKEGQDPEEEMRKESADLLLCILDFMYSKLGMTEEDMVRYLLPGLTKWDNYIDKNTRKE